MIKYFTSILILILFSANVTAGNLKAYFTYCTFNSPDSGPYIETYLSVVGSSAEYKINENNSYQSEIEVTLIFKQGAEIKKFKKFNLLSPELKDSLATKVNFLDQQRISLENGDYEFEISIKDLNANTPPFNSSQKLIINYPKDEICVSDIELIESLNKTTTKSIITKSGYDLIPYTSDFYPEDFEKIAFYSELYNADKVLGLDESFLISYYIETFENKKVAGDYKGFSRETAKPVNILLKSFNIGKLPSGNYNLVIEARDKNNEMLTKKKIFFQRSNPKSTPLLITNEYLSSFVVNISKNDINNYIECLEPISTKIEISFAQNQLNGKDEELMKQYFYNFWVKRNELDPETEWKSYYEKVKTAEKLFSTRIKKGYTTDRGRVFLMYGEPNTRTEIKSEPSSYPYEIWHYHKIKKFNNKKFVFYSPDMVTNDYPMLHSDMPGHIYNSQWKIQLHKRTNQPKDMDTKQNSDHYGGRADDYFNNPR